MQKVKSPYLHDKNYREEQKYRKAFKKALSEFQSKEYETASKILNEVIHRKNDERTKRKIQKVLLLLLVGEFYGMNTLNKILTNYGVKGNDYQQLWQRLSCRELLGMMNEWLWQLFSVEFCKRLLQSGSTQSRQKLTLVIDGSIFKQWLVEEEFGKYFAKYYSGQYKNAVYGFNVLLCGMVIGEVFYPLHFQLRLKSEKDPEVAKRILSKVHKKLNELASSQGVKLPTLYLSVDSGFRSKDLVAYCESCKIIYIGVPKVGHLINFGDRRMKISDLKTEYVEREAEYIAQNGIDAEPFVWRIRVWYKCMDREVTLLLFRLKGSKKVSVIFSPDLDIKAKTMRRHWFERTKIELLFRMIKNDFKIQQITVRNRLGFMKKLALALVKSVYAQLLTQRVKKTDISIRRLGFNGIRQLLIFNQIDKEWLDDLVSKKTFCKNNRT